MYAIYSDTDTLIKAERKTWVKTLRAHIKAQSDDDTVLDIKSKDKKKIDAVTDAELEDGSKYPMLGKKAGVINKTGGYTLRWDEPHEVTEPLSEHLGKFAMQVPTGIYAEHFDNSAADAIIDVEPDQLFLQETPV